MSAQEIFAYSVQSGIGRAAPLVTGPARPDVSTVLARALNRLLSATVDADLADGAELTVAQAGAREQALEAMALWDARHG